MLLHNMLKSTSDICIVNFPSERLALCNIVVNYNEIRNGIRTCGPT